MKTHASSNCYYNFANVFVESKCARIQRNFDFNVYIVNFKLNTVPLSICFFWISMPYESDTAFAKWDHRILWKSPAKPSEKKKKNTSDF